MAGFNVQGWSQPMSAGTVPHAHTVGMIEDLPRVTLYVETALVQNPTTPGFQADAKQEMLVAIAEMVEREGLDGYRIAWSMPLPASPVSIVAKTTLRPEPTVRPSVEDEADLAKNHEPADAA